MKNPDVFAHATDIFTMHRNGRDFEIRGGGGGGAKWEQLLLCHCFSTRSFQIPFQTMPLDVFMLEILQNYRRSSY